ncbi:MAG: class I SAM-dependent methyltransferase [Balneolaceae bacterium]
MSKSKLSDAQIKLAEQFRCPAGEQGIVVANSMNDTNIGMTMQTVKALSLAENDVVLEIGHGNAKHVAQIFNIQNKLTYTGLDISPLMYQEATKVNAELIEQKKANFMLSEGTTLPFPDEFFTKIFTVNTIYFWNNPEAMISELYRVLSPGGLCCITFAHKGFLEQHPILRETFNLYDMDLIHEISSHIPFKNISALNFTEQITSNTGEMVKRNYTVAILKKA